MDLLGVNRYNNINNKSIHFINHNKEIADDVTRIYDKGTSEYQTNDKS